MSWHGCRDAAKLIGAEKGDILCCSSCHEDDELGYADLPEFEYKGEDYAVCCLVRQALNEWVMKQE